MIFYFMHVRYSSRLTWVFAGAGFLWLMMLIVLTLSDFLTRAWLSSPAGTRDRLKTLLGRSSLVIDSDPD